MVTANMQGVATPPLDGVREGGEGCLLTGELARARLCFLESKLDFHSEGCSREQQ